MRGPLPSPTRQRRNAPTIPTTNLPASGRAGPVPKLPAWADVGKVGRAWWQWAWQTPAAAAWSEADHGAAVRRAQLQDRWEETGDDKLLARMVELERELGLTPKARAQLRWAIVEDQADASPEAADLAARRLARRERLASGQ